MPFIAAAALAAGAVALLLGLVLGGSVTARVIPGLPDAGALTRWGLPVSRHVMDVAAVLTVGLLLLASVGLPSAKGRLSTEAEGLVRAASWTALLWGVAAAATLVFQLSEIFGYPVTELVGDQITSYAGQVDQGVALMLVILLVTAVALFGRTATGAPAALALLATALVALLPPPLTGHAAAAGNHELATTGLALHVLTISVWAGGLCAVVWYALRGGAELSTAAHRYSRVALWAYIGVAVSGAASALARLSDVGQLFTTPYGLLMVAKTIGFAVLGYLGWRHRTVTLPALAEGRRHAFLRLAGGEVVLMSAVIGLAVALARTAPPPPREGTVDPVREVLGFSMPPPVSAQTLLTLWRPDLFFILLVAVLGGLYAAALLRLRRRGDRWPLGRTVSWAIGLLTVVAVNLTGVASYAPIMFSVHMVQHMTLNMVTPIFLVLGAPVTLALRALRPAERRGDRGPREWLVLALHSRFFAVLSHPLVATALFVGSTFALYFTPLFGYLMNNHLGHLYMSVHFLLVGALFFWLIIGVDPAPRSIPHLLRILLLFVTMAFHAFFGMALMSLSGPIAPEWYALVERPWGPTVLEDQNAGGGIAWSFGEVPNLIVLAALFVQWIRDDERTERRRERHAARGGAGGDSDLDAYNAYLAELDRRAQGGQRRE
nr:cytochrome c oxidase assembly protein [Allonocardiopsis opalescens]